MDLQRLGFTPTEVRVYLALLRIAPATGYALARAAGLARANAYGALEGLAARGAATRLPGKPARYTAVEPEALVDRLRREISLGLDSLARDLGRIPRPPQPPPPTIELLPDRVSLLRGAAECARAARSELLAVVGPWAQEIFGDLEGSSGRAAVRLLSLGSPGPRGAVVRDVPVRDIEGYWGGLPLALVADRRLAVCGILQRDQGGMGIATEHAGVVPFLRHLLRRELASAPPQRLS